MVTGVAVVTGDRTLGTIHTTRIRITHTIPLTTVVTDTILPVPLRIIMELIRTITMARTQRIRLLSIR